jgi:ABC-type branched-subunit amino acid transport system ATPase component
MSFRAENVYAGYVEGIDVLQGLTVEARDGLITTVIGANGVGKSTLLKCAIGQLRPHKGTIRFKDHDLTRVRTHELASLGIGYIAQRRQTFPHMTVQENLEIGAWSFRKDRAQTAAAIERVLKRVPMLAEFRRRRAGELSGGQQRLLEIERAMLLEPALLLVDEPTVGLDPKMTGMIYSHLRALSEDAGHTILIVDQNVVAGTDIADHIYVLELGTNKFDCSKAEFDAHYAKSIADWLI